MNDLISLFPDNERIYKRAFTVRYSEVNKFGIIMLRSIFDYLQQTAAEHANKLGFGMQSLYSNGMIWVLSKMSINISGSFRPEQKITVCTYPSGVERIFFRREFEIVDSETHEVLVRASSYWLLLDKDKLRPLRRDVLEGVSLENPDLPIFIHDFPSPEQTLTDMNEMFNAQVKFSQMDINQHLNNAQYANWIEDAVYEKLETSFMFKEVHVNFIQAQKFPDIITTSLAIGSNGSFNLSSVNKEKAVNAFSAFGKIKQIN